MDCLCLVGTVAGHVSQDLLHARQAVYQLNHIPSSPHAFSSMYTFESLFLFMYLCGCACVCPCVCECEHAHTCVHAHVCFREGRKNIRSTKHGCLETNSNLLEEQYITLPIALWFQSHLRINCVAFPFSEKQ